MKLFIRTLIIFSLYTLPAAAQQATESLQPSTDDCKCEGPACRNYAGNFSLGYHINTMSGDYGMGLHATSPYFFNKRIAIRTSGSMASHYGIINDSYENSWQQYYSLQAGLVGIFGTIGKRLRTYGTGGAIMIFPKTPLPGQSNTIGAYGHLGLEMNFYPALSCSMELGTVRSITYADRLAGQNTYSNHFSGRLGLHCYF